MVVMNRNKYPASDWRGDGPVQEALGKINVPGRWGGFNFLQIARSGIPDVLGTAVGHEKKVGDEKIGVAVMLDEILMGASHLAVVNARRYVPAAGGSFEPDFSFQFSLGMCVGEGIDLHAQICAPHRSVNPDNPRDSTFPDVTYRYSEGLSGQKSLDDFADGFFKSLEEVVA